MQNAPLLIDASPFLIDASPWVILAVYCAATWLSTPRAVAAPRFFDGKSASGKEPGILLVAFSAAITWVFAKSITNAADLGYAFGLAGSIGYTIYYLSFVVAGVTIYFMRTRGGWTSLPQMLTAKYGATCAKLFMAAIAFRLFNEVWSNTKVMALFFGPEGSASYWISAILVTVFTVAYAWAGGMRASLLTDRLQMIAAFILLGVLMAVLLPPMTSKGLPGVPISTHQAGLTFCLLALVQVLSYPFHDPVLTDRGFLNNPRKMLASFVLAGVLSGAFIFLFSFVGLYARAFELAGAPSLSVPASLGFGMMLLFNGMMLTSGGSTIDSTFTSVAKLSARDWSADALRPIERDLTIGRRAIIIVAIVGNLPLLSIYLGDRIGPAIIAATTISGTMVMGLAPIFLLSFVRGAGPLSFHLAFWPGLLLGIARAVETFAQVSLLPRWLALGTGRFDLDLGVNVWGLLLCTAGFLLGAAFTQMSVRARKTPARA